MNSENISRIGLIVAVCLIVMTGFIPALPPDLTLFFVIALLACIPALVVGRLKHRLCGAGLCLLSACLIGVQIYQGRQWKHQIEQARLKAEEAKKTEANQASQVVGDAVPPSER